MTIPQLTRITNDREYLDSLEVIDRIAILEQYQFAADLEGEELPEEEAEELAALVDLELAAKAKAPVSWQTGTTLVQFKHMFEYWPEAEMNTFRRRYVDFCGVIYALRAG